MNGVEVRAMKSPEMTEELGRLRARLFALRNKRVSEKVEDGTQFGKIRRDIARMLTEQTARSRPTGSAGSKSGPTATARTGSRASRKKQS